LGCVLSIAATWVVFGYPGIGQYRALRQRAIQKIINEKQSQHPSRRHPPDIAPSDYFHDGQRVLADVTLWHDVLRGSLRKTDAITERVLNLVDQHMLRSDPSHRIEAGSLSKQLSHIFSMQNQGVRQLLPESIMQALLAVDDEASTKAAKSISPRAAPQPDHSSPDFLDREAHKSYLLSLPPMKTTHRSEYLRDALASRSPKSDATDIIYESPIDDTDTMDNRPLSQVPGSKRARPWSAEQAAPLSPLTRAHPSPDALPTRTLTNESTMATAQWDMSQSRPTKKIKYQNVFQARDQLARRPRWSLDNLSRKKKERRKKDDVLSQHYENRDIVSSFLRN
jgi:hypothetical protein